jgi:hypothetical protein
MQYGTPPYLPQIDVGIGGSRVLFDAESPAGSFLSGVPTVAGNAGGDTAPRTESIAFALSIPYSTVGV